MDVEEIPYKPKDEVYANPWCIPDSEDSKLEKDELYDEPWCMPGMTSPKPRSDEPRHIIISLLEG